jgi:hypothetical protein
MPEAPIPAAVLAPEEVEPLVEQFLAEELVLPMDTHTWFMGVLADLETGSGTCPAWEVSAENPAQVSIFWAGTCTGSTYQATGTYAVRQLDELSPERHALHSVQLWSMEGEILTGTGGRLAASGQSELAWSQAEASATIRASVLGSFADAAGPPQLRAGVDPAVTVSGQFRWTDGFEGTLTGAAGMDERALAFDDVGFSGTCGANSGALGVRDPGGGWWRVDLADDCSGCGPLSYGGVQMGEVCAGAQLAERLDTQFRAFAEQL